MPVDVQSADPAQRFRAAVRPALGSLAFLASVEAAWRLHER